MICDKRYLCTHNQIRPTALGLFDKAIILTASPTGVGFGQMGLGYCGRILRVDLTEQKIVHENIGENFYRLYFGGTAIVAYYLLRELEPGTPPLSDENLLVFAPGVFTGAPIGGSGRLSIGAKSPLTNAFGDSQGGGYLGPELKRAGFDALVVRGKATEPSFIYVHDGEVEIRDARRLWGMEIADTQEALQTELGDKSIKTAIIGPAGEQLIPFANISIDVGHFAGRTGLGAVMGSKNLKAVVARGRNPIKMANPQIVFDNAKWLTSNIKLVYALHTHGTSNIVNGLNASGGLPTRNFNQGSFEFADAISGERLTESLLIGRRTCYACPIVCKRIVKGNRPDNMDTRYSGPEYETIASFGSNCGIRSLEVIAAANQKCNANGLDTISTGMAISFAMECYQKGILTESQVDGLELNFGSENAMLHLLDKIIKREGIGKLLSQGTARAAITLGRRADKCALTVKGQEVPMHEPRLKQGLSIGYATSPTGADHCHNYHDTYYVNKESKAFNDLRSFGILEPVDAADLGLRKVRAFTYLVNWRHFTNCAVMCYFMPFDFNQVVDIIGGLTGWNISLWEVLKIGERALTMAKAFNVREGLTGKDDSLPKRFFGPFESGPLKGVAVDENAFTEAVRAYYQVLGWDVETGIPTRAKLYELGIGWVADAGFSKIPQ